MAACGRKAIFASSSIGFLPQSHVICIFSLDTLLAYSPLARWRKWKITKYYRCVHMKERPSDKNTKQVSTARVAANKTKDEIYKVHATWNRMAPNKKKSKVLTYIVCTGKKDQTGLNDTIFDIFFFFNSLHSFLYWSPIFSTFLLLDNLGSRLAMKHLLLFASPFTFCTLYIMYGIWIHII